MILVNIAKGEVGDFHEMGDTVNLVYLVNPVILMILVILVE